MENKKTKIISIISIIALVLTVVTATYAYFQAQTGEGSQTDVKITANTVDTLTFETGNAISLSIDQDNFANGKGNQSGSTFAKAILTANNKTNTATEHYYLYLDIDNNTFIYTQNENTPEILLQITDEDGNSITTLSELKYKTITDGNGTSISGFDITNRKGLLTIFDNNEIIANSKKEDTWNIVIIFVNYDSDQSKNAGKSFSAKVIIQKNKMPKTISEICSDGDNLSTCITSLSEKSVSEATKIYYHDDTLTNGADDNSYRYAGGDAHEDLYLCKYNENIVLNNNHLESKSLKGDCSKIYKIETTDYTYYYDKSFEKNFYNTISVKWDSVNNVCLTSSNKNVYDWYGHNITNKNICTGNAYQYKESDNYYVGITEVGSGEETIVEYADEGVNNFICFGSTTSPCPTDNLYRIIGVIDGKVKLIKYDYMTTDELGTNGDYSKTYKEWGLDESRYKGTYGDGEKLGVYYWNYKADTTINDGYGSNTWSTSLLNKTNLNTNFINYLGTSWANKIATTTWKVGGNICDEPPYRETPLEIYQKEIKNPVATNTTDNATTYNAKIGLMYLSDYGYAANPNSWKLNMVNYNDITVTSNNWMYMGGFEWTLYRCAEYTEVETYIFSSGYANIENSHGDFAVRAVFNLEPTITYKSGSGTMSDPIIIN